MKKIVLIIIVQLQFLTLLVAQPTTYTWNGSRNTDDVTDPLNWSPTWSTPDFAPLMNYLIIPSGTPIDPVFGACNVGGSTSGTITINSGASANFYSLIIGDSGSGTVTNNGSMLIFTTLKVGNQAGGIGTFYNYATFSLGGTTTIGGTGVGARGTINNSGDLTLKTLNIGGLGTSATGSFVNSTNGFFTSANTTLNSKGTLTINGTAKGTVSGTLTNNGTLNLYSTSSGIFSLILNGYSSTTGIVHTQLALIGGGSPNYNWHYIAVPYTDGYDINDFVIVSQSLLGYDETRVTTNESQGWLWYDGAALNGVAAGTPFYWLDFGKGYNYYTPDGFTTITLNSSVGGVVGSSLGTISTSYSGGSINLTQSGYNLLGNSLTCSIDWNNVTPSAGVSSTVYYTTGNKWASYNPGSGGTMGGARYIPPLQGFFVKANATGASVNFTGAGVKVHSTQARYKKGSDSQEETKGDIIYPKVKLELTGNNTADETIVWFNENATTGYDEIYDGFKLFSSDASFGQLYSILNGNQFVINGIPLPSSTLTVPLGIMIPQSGVYSLDKKVLEVLDNYNVYLVDKMNGNYTVDIKSVNSYSFSSDAGTFTDRFVLKFDNILTRVENLPIVNKKFNVYGTKDFINIMPFDDFTNETTVRIYNLTGRIVKQAKISGFYKGSLLQLPFEGSQGIYIVEIRSGSIQISRDKVFVN
jgi:trimeric autotransporter adhesin